MNKNQIAYIMQGKTTDQIYFISFTAVYKIYPERYENITFNHDLGLVEIIDRNGRKDYWDYVDVNGIVFLPTDPNFNENLHRLL